MEINKLTKEQAQKIKDNWGEKWNYFIESSNRYNKTNDYQKIELTDEIRFIGFANYGRVLYGKYLGRMLPFTKRLQMLSVKESLLKKFAHHLSTGKSINESQFEILFDKQSQDIDDVIEIMTEYTSEIIRQQHKENDIELKYVYQKNQGKMEQENNLKFRYGIIEEIEKELLNGMPDSIHKLDVDLTSDIVETISIQENIVQAKLKDIKIHPSLIKATENLKYDSNYTGLVNEESENLSNASFSGLVNSIKSNGLIQNIIIDENYMVIAGTKRYKALLELFGQNYSMDFIIKPAVEDEALMLHMHSNIIHQGSHWEEYYISKEYSKAIQNMSHSEKIERYNKTATADILALQTLKPIGRVKNILRIGDSYTENFEGNKKMNFLSRIDKNEVMERFDEEQFDTLGRKIPKRAKLTLNNAYEEVKAWDKILNMHSSGEISDEEYNETLIAVLESKDSYPKQELARILREDKDISLENSDSDMESYHNETGIYVINKIYDVQTIKNEELLFIPYESFKF